VFCVVWNKSYPDVGAFRKLLFLVFMPALVPVMIVAQVLMGVMIWGLMYTEIKSK
jgi:hypothetical protein